MKLTKEQLDEILIGLKVYAPEFSNRSEDCNGDVIDTVNGIALLDVKEKSQITQPVAPSDR